MCRSCRSTNASESISLRLKSPPRHRCRGGFVWHQCIAFRSAHFFRRIARRIHCFLLTGAHATRNSEFGVPAYQFASIDLRINRLRDNRRTVHGPQPCQGEARPIESRRSDYICGAGEDGGDRRAVPPSRDVPVTCGTGARGQSSPTPDTSDAVACRCHLRTACAASEPIAGPMKLGPPQLRSGNGGRGAGPAAWAAARSTARPPTSRPEGVSPGEHRRDQQPREPRAQALAMRAAKKAGEEEGGPKKAAKKAARRRRRLRAKKKAAPKKKAAAAKKVGRKAAPKKKAAAARRRPQPKKAAPKKKAAAKKAGRRRPRATQEGRLQKGRGSVPADSMRRHVPPRCPEVGAVPRRHRAGRIADTRAPHGALSLLVRPDGDSLPERRQQIVHLRGGQQPRVALPRSSRNSFAASSSSSAAYTASVSVLPDTTGPWLASSTARASRAAAWIAGSIAGSPGR